MVLIHGTASSAGRWADLINDLQNDPAISERFQFWLFTYNTGNPIPLSALQLRTDLTAAVNKLDPDRRDPALHNMVLIGHSQGGLLAKMLVINSGSRFYDAFSSKPIDELTLTDETRETLRQALFVTPMPDVTRVIFIATPHRGSFVAGGSLPQLIGRLVTLPLRVTDWRRKRWSATVMPCGSIQRIYGSAASMGWLQAVRSVRPFPQFRSRQPSRPIRSSRCRAMVLSRLAMMGW